MTDLNMGPLPLINFARLDYDLRAALPGQLDGISQDKHANLTVHVKAGENAAALQPQIAAVIAAHDPAVLTPAQELAVAQTAAALELKAAGFDAWLSGVNSASTIVDIKARVRELGRVVWLVAKAQGLTDADDPGA